MSASPLRTTCIAAVLLSLVSADATALTGTASRPQLTSSEASTYTISKALAKAGPITALVTDNWNPTAGVALLSADFAVAADGSTRYRTVQSAIDAAVAAGGSTRRYISIKAGTYTELVCVPTNAPPLTVFGLGTNTQIDRVSIHWPGRNNGTQVLTGKDLVVDRENRIKQK